MYLLVSLFSCDGYVSRADQIVELYQVVAVQSARLDALEEENNRLRAVLDDSTLLWIGDLHNTLRITTSDSVDEPGTLEVRGAHLVVVGANLYVQSGLGLTGDVNGLGNLIIGYDEGESYLKTGSHNLIVGAGHQYSSFGALIAGYANTVDAPYGTVCGGVDGTVGAAYAAILGGEGNMVLAEGAAVIGGLINTATGVGSAVVGGEANVASGGWSAVLGGFQNEASGQHATLTGGRENLSLGMYSSLLCGLGQSLDDLCPSL